MEKDKTWSSVSADIDLIRAAQSAPDFESRCNAVRGKWEDGGLIEATTWSDKLGRTYDFVSEFFKQWAGAAPEWHLGSLEEPHSHIVVPGTNNGAESCVKNTRADAGNVVGSVGETLAFLLQQVEHVSNNAFDSQAVRPIGEALWQRAMDFKQLFKTNKIRDVPHGTGTHYCCAPRSDPDDGNVCDREDMSRLHASELVAAFVAQLQGSETTIEKLVRFAGPSGARIFGFKNAVAFCTCPAFPGPRRCFHTLALAIFLGKADPPDDMDPTPVSLAARGNKRKAPPRGAVPLSADQKDLKIVKLQTQLRRANELLRQGCGVAPLGADPEQAPTPHGWKPLRRLKAKTSMPVARIPDVAAGRDSIREAENAIACKQSEAFLAADPSIGKEEPDMHPDKPPQLGEPLEVAANGRCLTNCCLAAASPQTWASVRREHGTASDFSRMVLEDDMARDFLLTKVYEAGMSGSRVSQLLQGDYAEATDIPFFCTAIQGSIAVKPPPAEHGLQKTRYFGEGPLKMEVELYYLSGKGSPHYKLTQSWM